MVGDGGRWWEIVGDGGRWWEVTAVCWPTCSALASSDMLELWLSGPAAKPNGMQMGGCECEGWREGVPAFTFTVPALTFTVPARIGAL